MSSNPLRRVGEYLEEAAIGSTSVTHRLLNEVLSMTQAQAPSLQLRCDVAPTAKNFRLH